MKKSAIDLYNSLPNSMKDRELDIDRDNPSKAFETLLNHYGMVRKREVEYEAEEEEEKEDTPKSFCFSGSLISLGCEKELVSDWLKVRKTKKLTNTETALKGFLSEVEKSKKNINEVLKECVVKSWGGFKSEWIKEEHNLTIPKENKIYL